MTPTEIIATRLLGWKPCKAPKPWYDVPGFRWYANEIGERVRIAGNGQQCEGGNGDEWPDLTDYNDIRRMERALRERGLIAEYSNRLWKDCGTEGDMEYHYELLATAEQRVAAAVKVLEGLG